MSKRSVVHSTFVIERSFPATPARVFDAFADPKKKAKWFQGPPEWERDKQTMDFRVGGTETSIGGPKGGFVSAFTAVYQDIVPNERIIYTYEMQVDGTRISVSVSTIELTPEGSGTHFRLTEQGAYLDGSDDGSMREHGTREALNQLEASLTGG